MLKIFLITFVLSYSYLFADNDDSSFVYLSEGSFSLQFQITEKFLVKDFQGAVFSGKYLFTDKSALQVGFSTNFSNKDEHSFNEEPRYENDSFSIDINTRYLYYFTNNRLSPYIGFGPSLSYIQTSMKEYRQSVYDGNVIYKSDQTDAYVMGISAILGGEYFVTQHLSILAEYGIVFEYCFSKRTDRVTGEYDTKEYRLNPLNVKFGFSYNF